MKKPPTIPAPWVPSAFRSRRAVAHVSMLKLRDRLFGIMPAGVAVPGLHLLYDWELDGSAGPPPAMVAYLASALGCKIGELMEAP